MLARKSQDVVIFLCTDANNLYICKKNVISCDFYEGNWIAHQEETQGIWAYTTTSCRSVTCELQHARTHRERRGEHNRRKSGECSEYARTAADRDNQ